LIRPILRTHRERSWRGNSFKIKRRGEEEENLTRLPFPSWEPGNPNRRKVIRLTPLNGNTPIPLEGPRKEGGETRPFTGKWDGIIEVEWGAERREKENEKKKKGSSANRVRITAKHKHVLTRHPQERQRRYGVGPLP